MTIFLRFLDLKARGIVNSWPGLKDAVEKYDFPTGRYAGRRRVWTEQEIDEWVDGLPKATADAAPSLRGGAKTKHQAKASGKSPTLLPRTAEVE
jgi:hypothetical protein